MTSSVHHGQIVGQETSRQASQAHKSTSKVGNKTEAHHEKHGHSQNLAAQRKEKPLLSEMTLEPIGEEPTAFATILSTTIDEQNSQDNATNLSGTQVFYPLDAAPLTASPHKSADDDFSELNSLLSLQIENNALSNGLTNNLEGAKSSIAALSPNGRIKIQVSEVAAVARLQATEGAGGRPESLSQDGTTHLFFAGTNWSQTSGLSSSESDTDASMLHNISAANLPEADSIEPDSIEPDSIEQDSEDDIDNLALEAGAFEGVFQGIAASPSHHGGAKSETLTDTAGRTETEQLASNSMQAPNQAGLIGQTPHPKKGGGVISPFSTPQQAGSSESSPSGPAALGSVQQELLERFRSHGTAPNQIEPLLMAEAGADGDMPQIDGLATIGKRTGASALMNGQMGGNGGDWSGGHRGGGHESAKLHFDETGDMDALELGSEGEMFEFLEGEDLAEIIRSQQATELRAKPQSQSAQLTRDVAYQLGHAIKYRSDGQNGEIRVRLNPAALGEVKIRLQLENNKVRATISVDSEDTLKLLSRDVQALLGAWKDLGVEPHPEAVEFVLTNQEEANPEGELADEQGQGQGSADPDQDQAGNLHSNMLNDDSVLPGSQMDAELEDADFLNARLSFGIDRVDVHI